MDRGLYPTYFMHMEREDGKKVRVFFRPHSDFQYRVAEKRP